MARVTKNQRKNQKLVFSENVYQFKKGRKKPVMRKDINIIGKVRLDTPIALLEMNGKRDVFKDNLSGMTDSAMTDLMKVIKENNKSSNKNKRKYVYIIQEKKKK